MKLKLKSNYHELWHYAFDSEGMEFRLMSNEGPNRLEMFHLFQKNNIPHPFFGLYEDFIKKGFQESKKVVIYDDIHSHFGENKRLLTLSDVKGRDKGKYLSEYIDSVFPLFHDFISKSTRQIFIGNIGFTYHYFSYNDWRSNNGRVYISEPIEIDIPKWRSNIHYGMFAIDFVGEAYELKAIDFNCSPGIPSSLHKYISPTHMVNSIKSWIKNTSNG